MVIGGSAIHVATRYVYRDRQERIEYRYTLVTTLLCTVAWAVLGLVPLLGTLIHLFGWIEIVRWRYPGGWTRATLVLVCAWAAAVVILAALELTGIRCFSAIGVPGT